MTLNPGKFEEWYNVGTSQIIIPEGYFSVQISVVGAGGAGRRAGGGAGGTASREYAILSTEWGTTLTASIGAIVSSAAGLPTTLNGTLGGATITELKGEGGARGGVTIGGVGGSFSGGDSTNWPAENVSGGYGDDYAGANGAAGGIPGTNFFQNRGYGNSYGAGGIGHSTVFVNGTNGVVFCRWGV